ncbi:hypothetical protein [Nocardia wallacei]|uniref:hypothetical protein n=1 Tax=Nocardia wallacei TaxID=480035 RepID=UPI0024565A09|nr:hypothetical protein [Nocardia wallacei]
MSDEVVGLPTRVNRLFSTLHARGEPEQNVEGVAVSVSAMLGRTVPSTAITALRSDPHAAVSSDTELLEALARHFRVQVEYLTGPADEVVVIDRQLRLLAATRDAGVQHLDLRGDELDVDALARELSKLPRENSEPLDQQE